MHWFWNKNLLKILVWTVLIASCTLENTSTPYHLEEPDLFVKMAIPKENPLTNEGIALGRMLFYDPILSADSSMSCASCHEIQYSFSDQQQKSKGVRGERGNRSAMPLHNVGYYYKGLFWDGRAATLEAQVHFPIVDPLEFDHSWESVIDRLQNHSKYPVYFQAAFGQKEISKDLVTKALAQFERTLISSNSTYDQVVAGGNSFTASENRGFQIFFDMDPAKKLPHSECGHCHIDPLFTDLKFHNNGIEEIKSLEDFQDLGRGGVSRNKYDNGKFRTPSLRNVALTAPYMHDGRFTTLNEVLDHYVSGGHLADNASPNVRKLNFTEQDKQDLIAFLHTLTDSSFIQNPAYGNPFQN